MNLYIYIYIYIYIYMFSRYNFLLGSKTNTGRFWFSPELRPAACRAGSLYIYMS